MFLPIFFTFSDVSTFAESMLRHKVASHTRQYQSKHHHEHHFSGPFFEGPLNTTTGALQVAVHLHTEGIFNCRVGMLKDKTVSWSIVDRTAHTYTHLHRYTYFWSRAEYINRIDKLERMQAGRRKSKNGLTIIRMLTTGGGEKLVNYTNKANMLFFAQVLSSRIRYTRKYPFSLCQRND